ncbi:permease prefix domain 1-containing protein [Desulfosporosinus nitroreducens]|uniref:Permease prefix domain 1-containing protein n=1 Tax=Desulfosporosinus nitroreducens TaxID=2018668 RepID=A0ABT8QQE2_9FIRM|nr:permease prefix domain 1-containing protein [Desulfosporosinus nitroreducens]MCO1604063.1 permease prefix domain 1-containing protein [Desulfosporosinus nitroreducens]MDO0823568.1 permease prefix domain 1-containing protein [Desulfosporosinus nitroreducens]
MFDLETQIHSWSDHLRARGNLSDADIHELENHLRDEIEDLIVAGLTPDEAFLISVKRLGNVVAISHEFAKVNTESLWKHLLVDPIDSLAKQLNRRDITLVVIFALLAGTLFKIPELFGFGLLDQDGEIKIVFIKNFSFFILPFISAFFLIKRKSELKTWVTILGIFILAAVIINVYPSFDPHHTEVLTIFHLPLFLWLVVGATYIGREWQGSKGRMNFIRFTGEAFIYGVLVMAGVMVLFLFTLVIFQAIQIDVQKFLAEYLLIYGGCAAAMITVYLVEAKKSVVENFAPILAKIFSPLFLIIMAAFLIVMIITGNSPFMEREFLIAFDLMLALVLGLVLYVISARDIRQPANLFDYLNLALILTALVIDGVALSAILFRMSAFGITPNKLAALGENLALLGNLAGLAWLYIGYFKRKFDFSKIIKWQTDYLYVYFIWTAIVAFIFPIVFRFN